MTVPHPQRGVIHIIGLVVMLLLGAGVWLVISQAKKASNLQVEVEDLQARVARLEAKLATP